MNSLTFNDVLAFALEAAALILWGLWAGSLAKTPFWQWTLGILAVGIVVTLWALFFARTADNRPEMPWLLIGKLLILLPPGLLFFRGKTPHSLIWAGLVLLHLVLGTAQKGL